MANPKKSSLRTSPRVFFPLARSRSPSSAWLHSRKWPARSRQRRDSQLRLWKERFAGDPPSSAKSILLNGHPKPWWCWPSEFPVVHQGRSAQPAQSPKCGLPLSFRSRFTITNRSPAHDRGPHASIRVAIPLAGADPEERYRLRWRQEYPISTGTGASTSCLCASKSPAICVPLCCSLGAVAYRLD